MWRETLEDDTDNADIYRACSHMVHSLRRYSESWGTHDFRPQGCISPRVRMMYEWLSDAPEL